MICTIHQPSASVFEMFDHLFIIAEGKCLYQGSVKGLVPYLQESNLFCPSYHNPADYGTSHVHYFIDFNKILYCDVSVIEVAAGEHGEYTNLLVAKMRNGLNYDWRKSHSANNDFCLQSMENIGNVYIHESIRRVSLTYSSTFRFKNVRACVLSNINPTRICNTYY